MRRKIIKQGIGGCTVFLPIKWVRQNNLIPGNEVVIEEQNNSLLLSTDYIKKEKKTITLTIDNVRESALRTPIVNAYRAGFDIINVKCTRPGDEITQIVELYLMGFDHNKDEKGNYVIQSVAEPDGENFESILRRQFYIINDILESVRTVDIDSQVQKIQRYDNFLKRCISKNMISMPGHVFLWKFLSSLTHIARACFHFQKIMDKRDNVHVTSFVHELRKMFSIIQKAYMKKDSSILSMLHEHEQKLIRDNVYVKKVDSGTLYHLKTIAHAIYLSNSPLTGLILSSTA